MKAAPCMTLKGLMFLFLFLSHFGSHTVSNDRWVFEWIYKAEVSVIYGSVQLLPTHRQVQVYKWSHTDRAAWLDFQLSEIWTFFLWFLFCFIVNISIVFQHPQHYITAFLFASCSQSSLQLLVCLNFVHCNPLAELLPRTAQYPVVYVIFFYQYLTTWTHDVFSFTVSAFSYLFAFLLWVAVNDKSETESVVKKILKYMYFLVFLLSVFKCKSSQTCSNVPLTLPFTLLSMSHVTRACVRLCVWERERTRERACVRVC